MTFDLQRIIESNRARRRLLAQRPVAEKLALLDELRERTLTIRAAAKRQQARVLRESPPKYPVEPPKG